MGPIEPNKVHLLKGETLQTLLKEPKGVRDQIRVDIRDGQVFIGFANMERFKVVRNGVVMTFYIPCQLTEN